MRVVVAAIMAAYCAQCAAGEGNDRSDAYRFSGFVRCDAGSGYISTSGGLSDTHPVSTHMLFLRQNMGDLGFLDGYVWSISALHDKQHDKHGQLLYWAEGAAHYGYELPLWEGALLQTKAGPFCGLHLDYVQKHNSSIGVSAAQRLDNPYVTPYWGGIWLHKPSRKGLVVAGISKEIEFCDDLVLSAYFQPTWMDRRRYMGRYGSSMGEKALMGGAVAFVLFGVQLDWKVSDNVKFYVALSQYDVVNRQARRSIKCGGHYYDKCDWPIFRMGVRLMF